jgi:hypothetical protein
VLIVDALIISGVKFVLTRIAEAVEAEMYDETALREELLAAQMKVELGEMTDEEFLAIEEEVLAGMRAIRERREAEGGAAASGDTGGRFTVASVEANLDRDDLK